LELIKDYGLGTNYHPGKANVVADALSQRSHVSQLVVDSMPFELCEEFEKLNLRIVANTEAMEMEVGSILLQEIRRGQLEDEKVQEIKCNIKGEKSSSFSEDDEGVLWYKGMTELYMSRIVWLHGVPKKIVSNKGTQFTLKF
jgi:hypothetical protein